MPRRVSVSCLRGAWPKAPDRDQTGCGGSRAGTDRRVATTGEESQAGPQGTLARAGDTRRRTDTATALASPPQVSQLQVSATPALPGRSYEEETTDGVEDEPRIDTKSDGSP